MPILISIKKKGFVDLAHGIIRRDSFSFLLRSGFGWGMELRKRGAWENWGWTFVVERLQHQQLDVCWAQVNDDDSDQDQGLDAQRMQRTASIREEVVR